MASSTDHLLASKRRRKELGALIHESASAPVSDTARSMMMKMGWSADTGLGKRRDGMVTHIRAVKRVDQAGLGVSVLTVEQQQHGGPEWWKDSVGSTLAKLAAGGSSSKKKDKKSKKDKKHKSTEPRKHHYTDEELFEATGGKRFGMRAAPTSNLHKWKRTNDDGIIAATATASDVDASSLVLARSTKEAAAPVAVDESKQLSEKELHDEAVELETSERKRKAKKEKKPKKDKKKRKRE